MRWRKSALRTMTERVQQLGLQNCAVCGSQDALGVWTGPAILYMGQPLAFQELRAREPDGRMLFMIVIECSTCGHTQLFNSDRFYTGDKDILFSGTAEAEAALDAHDEEHGGP